MVLKGSGHGFGGENRRKVKEKMVSFVKERVLPAC
jgi:hypothetical protein